MGPCPLPGGRIVFTSNRDGFRPAKGYPAIALQLFVMDDRDESVGDDDTPEQPGKDRPPELCRGAASGGAGRRPDHVQHAGIAGHPQRHPWGIWTIHPDGTNWNPLVSAFDPGGASNGFHFQTQLSDGSIVVEEYYNQNNSGFGAYIKIAAKRRRRDTPAFGPGNMNDPRTRPGGSAGIDNGKRAVLPHAVHADRVGVAHAVRLGCEGPADPSDPERQRLAQGRQVHASFRRAGQSPADRATRRAR